MNREHRRLWKHHFAGAGAASQVLKALALLVESGCIYCALLVGIALPSNFPSSFTRNIQIFMIVYLTNPGAYQASADSQFATVAFTFIYGCMVPILVSCQRTYP